MHPERWTEDFEEALTNAVEVISDEDDSTMATEAKQPQDVLEED